MQSRPRLDSGKSSPGDNNESLLGGPISLADAGPGAPPPAQAYAMQPTQGAMQPMPVSTGLLGANGAPLAQAVPPYPPGQYQQQSAPRGAAGPSASGYGQPPGYPPSGQPTQNAFQGGAYKQPGPSAPVGGDTCPVMCNAATGANFPLERCSVSVDVHMASMFVTLVGSWRVQSSGPTTGLFKRASHTHVHTTRSRHATLVAPGAIALSCALFSCLHSLSLHASHKLR